MYTGDIPTISYERLMEIDARYGDVVFLATLDELQERREQGKSYLIEGQAHGTRRTLYVCRPVTEDDTAPLNIDALLRQMDRKGA